MENVGNTLSAIDSIGELSVRLMDPKTPRERQKIQTKINDLHASNRCSPRCTQLQQAMRPT